MARRRTLSLITAGVQKNGKPVGMDILEQVVKNHSEQARAPITLGHPDKDADQVAALGRVSLPRIDGDQLVVELVYTPELEQLEDEGKFEGFSAGIYPRPDTGEYYLHHVASLGQLPPAADIKTRDVVKLSTPNPESMITLSTSNKGFKMDENEKKALVTEIVGEVKESLGTMVTEAIKTANGEKQPGKGNDKTGTGEDKDKTSTTTTTDPEVVKMQKQLEGMQENAKTDRIEQITELADKKGLSDDEKKPLLAQLKARPALEFADNSETGIFATTKAMLNARADKTAATTHDNGLFDKLEFSDHKGNKQTVENMGDLALKTGF